MASIGSQGVASSCHFLLRGLVSSRSLLCASGAVPSREGSACSPLIVSVSMAPQVGDSQVLEWTGRLMPWKGEVSSLFSAQLNIVSKDVLPIPPILGQARKECFQLCAFQLAPFQMEGSGGPHCKEILHTQLKMPISAPHLNALYLY